MKKIHRRYDPIKEEQLEILIKTVENSRGRYGKRDACVIFLLSRTGMRISETLAIHLSDIDFSEQVITLRAENTKTKTERKVYMIPELSDYLQKYICSQKELIDQSEGHIFWTQNGGINAGRKRNSARHLTRITFGRAYRNHLINSGLFEIKYFDKFGMAHHKYRIHDFRKYFAFKLFKENPTARLNEIALCTGHKNLNILADIYIQANERDTQKELMGKAFRNSMFFK